MKPKSIRGAASGAIVASIALAACANQPVIQSAVSEAGYADGCESGKYDAGSVAVYRKDEARFARTAEYAEGWTTGYRRCNIEALADYEKRYRSMRD